MEDLLLGLGKYRWYIRYPAAAFAVGSAWYLVTTFHHFAIPVILLACAAVITIELSPTILLMAASVWLWPDDLLGTPLAQLTLGTLLTGLISVLIFIAAPLVGLVLHLHRQTAAETV